MSGVARSESRSAVPRLGRTGSRTIADRRPPRRYRNHGQAPAPLWQLTTRSPRSGRSGSQLPVEAGFSMFVRAGRTVVLRKRANVVWCE